MSIESFKLKKAGFYFLTFVFVMSLNLGLGIFLYNTVFAQKSEDFRNQLPVKTEVERQEGNPLSVTVVNVDNSDKSFQVTELVIQNISRHSIKGFVILGSSKGSGKIVKEFYPVSSFQSGLNYSTELFWERSTLEQSDTISFSVDYVELEDGTIWGKDTQNNLAHFEAVREGVIAAARQIKLQIEAQGITSLESIQNKKLIDIDVPIPNSIQDEESKKGFENGYKSVLYFIKGQKNQEPENLLNRLAELIESNKIERRKEK